MVGLPAGDAGEGRPGVRRVLVVGEVPHVEAAQFLDVVPEHVGHRPVDVDDLTVVSQIPMAAAAFANSA